MSGVKRIVGCSATGLMISSTHVTSRILLFPSHRKVRKPALGSMEDIPDLYDCIPIPYTCDRGVGTGFLGFMGHEEVIKDEMGVM